MRLHLKKKESEKSCAQDCGTQLDFIQKSVNVIVETKQITQLCLGSVLCEHSDAEPIKYLKILFFSHLECALPKIMPQNTLCSNKLNVAIWNMYALIQSGVESR